jgi:hypothetical protein
MNISIFKSLDLDPEKVMVNRVKTSPDNVQLLFTDANYTSIIIDTKELLYYLESLTEQVRLVDAKQNPRDL